MTHDTLASSDKFQRGLLVFFCLFLAWMPLPFGSNRMWSASLAVMVAGGMAMVAGYKMWRAPESFSLRLDKSVRLAGALIALVMAWVLVQMHGKTPSVWHHPLWAESFAILGMAGFAPPNESGAIALDPAASYLSLLRLAGYVLCFWLAYILASTRVNAQTILRVLVCVAFACAVYGLIVDALGLQTVLWYPKTQYENEVTSTFINHNSYATYAGLGLICCVAYVAHRWQKAADKVSRRFFWRNFLPHFLSRELIFAILPLTVFSALILSESRAGFVSSMIGVMVFSLAMAVNKKLSPGKFLLGLGVGGVIFAMLFIAGGQGLDTRLSAQKIADSLPDRLNVYHLVIESIRENPVLGYGLGNFDSVFPLYRDGKIVMWFQHAHNDYLESVMDLGVPVALMLWSAMAVLAGMCARGVFYRRRDVIYPALGLAATVIVALHALLDFSLQIPAVTVTYATLLGMGVAQSRSSRSVS